MVMVSGSDQFAVRYREAGRKMGAERRVGMGTTNGAKDRSGKRADRGRE
jgi:hypothetical protein